jgi:hypothetical protein
MITKIAALLVGLVATASLHAAPVYDNTTTDTLQTVSYSANAFTEIGDRITLGGTERHVDTATAEFFNGGSDAGSFAATLRFYDAASGNPGVGGLLASFTVAVGAIDAGGILDVNWSLGGLLLPDDVVFTVAISRVSAGLDLGLNLFEPPTVGSSDNKFFIARNDGGFTQATTGLDLDNVFFRLDVAGSTVPEPGSLALLSLAGLSLLRVRGRRSTAR